MNCNSPHSSAQPATHPSQRGKGLAVVLLGRLLKNFKARGYLSARLLTQLERLPAIRTYLKFGFVPKYEVDGRNDRSTWSDIFHALATPKRMMCGESDIG